MLFNVGLFPRCPSFAAVLPLVTAGASAAEATPRVRANEVAALLAIPRVRRTKYEILSSALLTTAVRKHNGNFLLIPVTPGG